jgi:cell division protein FtsQ
MRAARRRRIRPAAPWTLVVAATSLAILLGWLLWASPVLAVQEVQVRGTSLLAAAQVREQAAVTELTPLLRVRTGDVAARVAALAPVAEVDVRRQWPDTIVIEVVERTPVAAVPAGAESGAEYGLLDPDGVVFFTVAQPPAGLPLVSVPAAGPDDPATRAALTVLAALTPQLRAELETLTVAGPARIRLELRSGRTVVWGDESASEEKARVATALLAREAEEIDVSVPEVVVLR